MANTKFFAFTVKRPVKSPVSKSLFFGVAKNAYIYKKTSTLVFSFLQ